VLGGVALGAGGIVGLLVVLVLILLIAVDATFCKTKQCGLMFTLWKAFGQKDEDPEAANKSPEEK
jgi:hypothetical protein